MAEKTEIATAPPPDQETLERAWTKLRSFLQSLPEEEQRAMPYLQKMSRGQGEEVEGYFWGIDCGGSVYFHCSTMAGADPFWDASYTIKDYAAYETCMHSYGCYGW